jgi:hypothetical protein
MTASKYIIYVLKYLVSYPAKNFNTCDDNQSKARPAVREGPRAVSMILEFWQKHITRRLKNNKSWPVAKPYGVITASSAQISYILLIMAIERSAGIVG